MNGQDKERIGFVGVGLMGQGMARHAMLKGHPLTVCAHRNRGPVDDLVSQGADEAKDLAALAAASDIVILCVSDSDAVDQALFGDGGLLAGARPGTVFIDTSTSFPERTRAANQRLRAAGMLMADAPLSRSPARAAQGELVSLVACEDALFERVKPVLETYSEVVIRIGAEVGMAHEVKLINNFIALSYVCTWAEAYNACLAKGIDPKGLHATVSAAGLNSLNFQNYSKFVLENTQEGHKFAVRNCHKDMRYYTRFATEAGISTMVADPVLQLFRLAEAHGYGEDYATVMPKVVGELNKTAAGELPRAAPTAE